MTDKFFTQISGGMNGIIMMGPRAVAMKIKIAENLEQEGYMQTIKHHLISDLFGPMLDARTPDDISYDDIRIDYAKE
jgi:hypothetical protein